jgi:hypothetical protein
VLYAVFLLIVGLITVIWPRFWWNLTRWQYRHPEAVEPSAAAFTVGRVAGGVLALLAVIGMAAMADTSSSEASDEDESAGRSTPELIAAYVADMQELSGKRGVPVRQLQDKDIQAKRDEHADESGQGFDAAPAAGFRENGKVNITVGGINSDPKENTCITFADAGEPVIGKPWCTEELDTQRRWVNQIAGDVMQLARTKGRSPRNDELIEEVARPWITWYTRNVGLTVHETEEDGLVYIDFNRNDGVRQTWCLRFPAENSGTVEVMDHICPARSAP